MQTAQAQGDTYCWHREPAEIASNGQGCCFVLFCFFAEERDVPGPAGNLQQWHSVSTLCKQSLGWGQALNSQFLEMREATMKVWWLLTQLEANGPCSFK